MASQADAGGLFQVLNEIGIIHQLIQTEMNRRLPDGLHASHFGVLNHLVRLGDGRTPVAIASAFQVTKATMTNTLGRLTERGLIQIAPNPKDGRSKLVFLTDEGRAFREDAIRRLGPGMQQIAENVDIGGLMATLPALQELRQHLDNNRASF